MTSTRSDSHRITSDDIERFPILIVGNLLSKSNGIRSVCEDLSIQLENNGWIVFKTSTHLGKIRRLTDMVATTIRHRKQFDVAQVNVYSGASFLWAEAVVWTLCRLGKPFVLTLHGGNLPKFARRWPGRVKRLLNSACCVSTPSDYLLEQMRTYCDHLQKIPNALDLNQYRYYHRSLARPKLVWLRSFHQIYNPSLAPRVLALLQKDFPDAELMMIGPDKQDGSRVETEATIAQLGLTDRVRIIGRIPKGEVSHWLNEGDILLNTTNFDNTPVSLLEAMACGLCIVTTNVGGIPYLVHQEKNALLVPPNDPIAMAAAVTRCLNEPALASSLSASGRQTVEAFDWPVVLPQWRALLSNAMRKRG